VFAASGMLISSWISRIATVRAELHVDPGRLGLIFLGVSVGAVLGLPSAGPVVGRFGTRRTVRGAATVSCGGMAIVAFTTGGPVPLLVLGLFLTGVGYGAWDVAMNVEGAAAERLLRRSVLPRLHAGFSVGTVIGALVGAALESLGVGPRPHLLGASILLLAGIWAVTRHFLPDDEARRAPGGADGAPTSPPARTVWLERRTILLGLFTLAFAFTEGSASDWLAVGTVTGYHRSGAVGSLVFATFVAAMTAARFASSRLLDRFGRVVVLRTSAVVAFCGVTAYIVGPAIGFAFVGAAVWGLGTAPGFPVGMSAAAEDPVRGHARVGVVSTVAYTAFLAGPPFVGFLGDHLGVRHALVATAVLTLAGFVLAGVTRSQRPPVRR
jgi:MFS family permease